MLSDGTTLYLVKKSFLKLIKSLDLTISLLEIKEMEHAK